MRGAEVGTACSSSLCVAGAWYMHVVQLLNGCGCRHVCTSITCTAAYEMCKGHPRSEPPPSVAMQHSTSRCCSAHVRCHPPHSCPTAPLLASPHRVAVEFSCCRSPILPMMRPPPVAVHRPDIVRQTCRAVQRSPAPLPPRPALSPLCRAPGGASTALLAHEPGAAPPGGGVPLAGCRRRAALLRAAGPR
jgi:hypothetical protein